MVICIRKYKFSANILGNSPHITLRHYDVWPTGLYGSLFSDRFPGPTRNFGGLDGILLVVNP